MTIDFYKISDDPRVLEKTLGTLLYTCNANILGTCSVHDPVLVLSYNSNLVTANYFHISDWGAYYFMGEPELSPGGRCIIRGTKDVLFSNKDEILNLHAYCSRCESKAEKYAVDSAPLSLVTSNVTNIPFSLHPFSASGQYARMYMLTVKGGKLPTPSP